MTVRFDDAGDALASHRTLDLQQRGLSGRPRRQSRSPTTPSRRPPKTKNEVGVAYLFNTDQPLDKLTFVYKTPGTIVNSGFDYELKDIELP